MFGVGGDALVAIALAGSLFFSVDPAGARWRILLYLIFTMAPFAVVGPLIGPAMDRAKGGRRVMLIGSTLGRVLVAAMMIPAVASESLWLFPEAFLMLILAKTYQVSKAAIVPTVTKGDKELVEANSKLQLLSGLAGFAAGLPGLIAMLIGPGYTMALAVIAFSLASVTAFRVPSTTVAEEPAGADETAELRSAAVVTAGSTMGALRAMVGFVTFMTAFALRGAGLISRSGQVMGRLAAGEVGGTAELSDLTPPGTPPTWHFGVVVAATVVAGLGGAALAPALRHRFALERLLFASVLVAVLGGVGGFLFGGLFGLVLLATGIASASTAGKQAFDAVVQRDAPDANRGRTFARFESRFQVAWVAGAVVPVIIPMPIQLGGLVVACVSAAAGLLYLAGMRAVERGEHPPKLPGAKEVGGKLKGQLKKRQGDPGSRPKRRRPRSGDRPTTEQPCEDPADPADEA